MSETNAKKDGISPLNGEIDSIVEEVIKKYHVPGLSIAVVDNGQIYSKGYGFANLPSTPATADTLYYAASTTKAFIAATAGRLMEEPKYKKSLKWSTPLKTILKDNFVLQDEQATNHATIEDALSHRSGLPRHDTAYGWTGPTQLSFIKTMRFLPFSEEFRTIWQYCNTAYAAVGAFLEELTGKPTGQLLKELLWEPLGMKSTFFDLTSAAKHASEQTEINLARGYHWVDQKHRSELSGGGAFVPEPYMNLDSLAAAGANISSANDYALWIKALLSSAADAPSPNSYPGQKPKSKDTSGSNQVITPELFTQLTTPRATVSRPSPFPDTPTMAPVLNPDLYALGWFISPRIFPGELVVHHSGGMCGFGAQLFMLPEYGFGLITFANTAITSNVVGELVAYELMARKLGLTEEKKADLIERKTKFIEKVLDMFGFDYEGKLEEKEEDDDESKKNEKEEKEGKEEKGPSKHEVINEILSHKVDVPNSFDVKKFEGEYHNPGYGTYIFEMVDENFVKDMRIIRKSKVKKGKGKEEEENLDTKVLSDLQPSDISTTSSTTTTTVITPRSGKNHPILLVYPKGRRIWEFRLLLRHQSFSSELKSHFFSLETINQHGVSSSTNPDPIKLPTNLPSAEDQQKKEKQMTVITGGDEINAGGVFVFEKGEQTKSKVGLMMESDLNDSASRNDKPWQDGLIWFDRVE